MRHLPVHGALLAALALVASAATPGAAGAAAAGSTPREYGSGWGAPAGWGDPGTPDASPGSGTGDATDPGTNDPASTDPGAPSGAPGPAAVSPGGPPTAVVPAVPAPTEGNPPKRPHRGISDAPATSGPTVPGTTARLLGNGRAAAPAAAPRFVKVMIWTANRLIGLPYHYGGGHAAFSDRAYDCSGAVSYALHAAGLLDLTLDSTELAKWGLSGQGRWVTVYANTGHAWMTVAGLRLDTSAVDDPGGLAGPRWRPQMRPVDRFKVRHPVAGA